jgi:hypothetical protein
MEGSFRLFLEECDSLQVCSDFSFTIKGLITCQGIQIMNDTSSFGGFINSFLVSLRDEAVKLPCLVFPLLSDTVSRHNNIHDVRILSQL